MSMQSNRFGAFVLTKNEAKNIGRCLDSLATAGWDVVVLDSGSTDETVSIVAGYPFAELRPYAYRDHCTAYNEITSKIAKEYSHVVILDADMIVSEQLQRELEQLFSVEPDLEVVEAQILMCVEGSPLLFGSLYPPKPFAFAVGRDYFVNLGHGEKLCNNILVRRVREKLRHDDRKSFAAYLSSQVRYSRNLVLRSVSGEVSGRDRIRVRFPFLILAVPFVSYILKGGFLSGKAGAIYALDRLVAEAIMYRRALSGVEND